MLLIGVGAAGYKLGWFDKPKVTDISAQTPAPQSSGLPAIEMDAPEAPAVTQLDLSGDWSAHAHSSYIYSNAKEDESHIYFLPDTLYTKNPSRLFRMKRDGSEMEEILLSGAESGIDSFAVLGDTIYYSLEIKSGVYGYFAAPKAGGDARFPFFNEGANIVAHDGKLYFLFSEQDAVGVLAPSVSMNTIKTYPLHTPEGASYVLLCSTSPFSVVI